MPRRRQPLVISFSGIDGAGKSTQIERLCERLRGRGITFHCYAFWDDVVPLPRVRTRFSHTVLHSEGGVGSPERPVKRADKNVRRWYLTGLRAIFYALDAIWLRRAVSRARKRNLQTIVFDRYIYDQLANVPGHGLGRLYTWLILRLAPAADIAFLLDADPQAALLRKPEYPLEFLKTYRRSYLSLRALASEMVLIPAGDIDSVEERIWRKTERRLLEDSPLLAQERAPGACKLELH